MVLPPRGPDGMIPSGPPSSGPATQCPSLCEAGPCRHYHKLATIMDAQEPLVGSDPLRRLITRACYPSPGINLELMGEEPVLQCSRWEPDNEQGRLGELRKQYLKTADGKAFAAQVAAFDEAQQEAEEVQRAFEQPIESFESVEPSARSIAAHAYVAAQEPSGKMPPVSIAAKPADEATRDQLARDSYKVTP